MSDPPEPYHLLMNFLFVFLIVCTQLEHLFCLYFFSPFSSLLPSQFLLGFPDSPPSPGAPLTTDSSEGRRSVTACRLPWKKPISGCFLSMQKAKACVLSQGKFVTAKLAGILG